MTITIPINNIKKALQDATTALISSMGETITYTFQDGTAPVTIRAVRQKVKEEELTGTYRQGDCKFTIEAGTLPKPPEKFDEILAQDGRTYVLFDVLACDVGIDNSVLAYRPVGRGA